MNILILANHQTGLYKFRKELLEALVRFDHKVYVSVPEYIYTERLKKIGVTVIRDDRLDRHGTNPIKDINLYRYYKCLLKQLNPDVVLTYTIKPNVYGGYACRRCRIPYIANVTGLGTSIKNGGLIQKVILLMYRSGLKGAKKVFFQNSENLDYMISNGIVDRDITDLLPGSGVNTDEHIYEVYPSSDDHVIFTIIGRIMKDKGIDEVLSAAEVLRKNYPFTEFRLIGDFDEEYADIVKEYENRGCVKYLGYHDNVHQYIAESHAIIHASYHEGMSNVLQEAASSGRPVIATNVHGCKEIFDPDVTGIAFEPRSSEALVNAVERFLSLTHEQKEQMGRLGREKMVREFDRGIVVGKYICELNGLMKKED